MSTAKEVITFENHYIVECIGPDGKLKWTNEFDNLVTNEGLNDNLDKYLKAPHILPHSMLVLPMELPL